jgi:hypothetical protein
MTVREIGPKETVTKGGRGQDQGVGYRTSVEGDQEVKTYVLSLLVRLLEQSVYFHIISRT